MKMIISKINIPAKKPSIITSESKLKRWSARPTSSTLPSTIVSEIFIRRLRISKKGRRNRVDGILTRLAYKNNLQGAITSNPFHSFIIRLERNTINIFEKVETEALLSSFFTSFTELYF